MLYKTIFMSLAKQCVKAFPKTMKPDPETNEGIAAVFNYYSTLDKRSQYLSKRLDKVGAERDILEKQYIVMKMLAWELLKKHPKKTRKYGKELGITFTDRITINLNLEKRTSSKRESS